MQQVTRLREVLRPHLGWHGARLSFVAAFLIALVQVKTVNLSELATAFGGETPIASPYQRLQRFFRDFEIDSAVLARTVVGLLNIPELWGVSVDRTEWQFGQCKFTTF